MTLEKRRTWSLLLRISWEGLTCIRIRVMNRAYRLRLATLWMDQNQLINITRSKLLKIPLACTTDGGK